MKRGCAADHDKMLKIAATEPPTPENLYLVAKDIADHSGEDIHSGYSKTEVVSAIMFELKKEVVNTFFGIE